ncbi:winged helix-turn-helix domain-containing protein [Solwaraspora sp. WMMD937]|uniref:ArsR/SmtB family transcription factor n=1 Tax=Solwaraspora sp. WMMD937 TaxID=3016090 RepID=UPI00249AB2D8|nr:winged helix-turn-helix domain-containing protein [Solwaraspora sp. WMMD937]WFE19179.1 winged helix-turn-helix domain-containing protein [Solwaraspora sp. WMMD937]
MSSVPRQPGSARPPGGTGPPTPAVRVIEGVNQLRAVADPIRLRVLAVLTTEPDRALSARQLAHQLGITFSLMHYHLRVLSDEGMIRVVNQRTDQGRAERYFQAAQLALRWDFPPADRAGDDIAPANRAGDGGSDGKQAG